MYRLFYLCPLLLVSCLNISERISNEDVIVFPNEEIEESLNTLRSSPERYHSFVNQLITIGMSNMTITLNKILATTEASAEDVLFSPISITCALALVLLGANGNTFKEISDVLGLTAGIPGVEMNSHIFHEQFSKILITLAASSGFEIGLDVNVATALFVQSDFPVRALYKTSAQDLYKSSVVNVDFKRDALSAQSQINNWVSFRTKGKINSLLSDAPPPDTTVIIASALYFKAEWEKHFFEGFTRRRPFFVNGRKSPSTIEVEMMSNGGDFPYYRDKDLECEILGFPYKGNKSTMYVVMPFDSSKDKLKEFISKLTVQDLDRLVKKTALTGVITIFPRMKIETSIDLRQTLKIMGIKSLFNPKESNLALLSKRKDEPAISNNMTLDTIRQMINKESSDNGYLNPGLYADNVIHKVYMDITETGTEAAAATMVSLAKDGSKVTFRVDVPFFIFIRDEETETILFWGSVAVPTPSFTRSN